MEKKVKFPVIDNNEKRQALINRMENTVLTILEQIYQQQIPKLPYPSTHLDIWSNQVQSLDADNIQDDEILSVALTCPVFVDESETKDSYEQATVQEPKSVIDFTTARGRIKMTKVMTILAQAHQLVITHKVQTKRSFYYELKGGPAASIFDQQTHVDQAVCQVANLFHCTTWELGFIASAKGLVSGNLILTFENGDAINCTPPGGVLIPQVESSTAGQITHINFSATSILVVEKESVFQKLLEEDCPRRLKTILITGKGYPDVATRFFVKLLEEKLKLPVYIMVDANPHGFEIMCTYKYGSASLWWEKENLTCPTMQWIGIYPSELICLCLPRLALSDNDKMKLYSLEKRPYITEKESLELKKMHHGKAEIEALVSITTSSFLTSRYLTTKIPESIN